ncbi:MAG: pyrroline-5-carboxylate reductase [Eubacteriales bacterium]|nr:pyrroline-5-carboxylate reductase [Eubacteriales bacterium]
MKVGFIGCGNMAQAMIKGITGSGKVSAKEIMASSKTGKTTEMMKQESGIMVGTNREVAEFADVLFLAVKPHQYEDVIKEITDVVTEEKIIVTIAPGKTIDWLQDKFGKNVKIVRTMPNTPALVKEAMMGLCCSREVSEAEMEEICSLCDSFGKTDIVPEKLLDVVAGVSGSSPAYVFMFIEAMADAAVADGMPRKQAYKFAAQAVLGSAKMVLETGMHPGELKDMVCSPGGTTIEAVSVLEEKGLRSAVIKAQRACVKKARDM